MKNGGSGSRTERLKVWSVGWLAGKAPCVLRRRRPLRPNPHL